MQRDKLYAALQTQLAALQAAPYNVLVVSRGFVLWDAANAQPAIYIVPRQEKAEYVRGVPVKWLISADIYVYVRWTDSVLQGTTTLAQIMDGVDHILSPTGPNGSPSGNTAVNTLGGIAVYCALQGSCEISAGFLNRQQTVARMPVDIMVAGG